MGEAMGLRTITAAVVLASGMLLCACAAEQRSDAVFFAQLVELHDKRAQRVAMC